MLIWLSPTTKQMDLGHSCYCELSFSRRFSIPGRPAVVSLGTKKVKQSWVFGSRTPNGGAINVPLIAGSSNRFIDAEILEKDFKFNPSFDEYVKAMESVRTVREKQKRISKRDNSKKAERSHLGDFDGQTQIGNVGGRIDSKGRVRTEFKDAKKVGFEDAGNTGTASNLVREELEGKERKKHEAFNRKFDMATKNGEWEKKRRNGEVKRKNFKSDNDSSKGTKTGIGLERISTQVEAVPCEKPAVENVKLRRSNKFVAKNTIDGEVEWERAAFRSLGDLTDVVDKPRASRNELEERIQKLARCLNGADIDMPEWMFSKMIRSARIRFADHSMVRIIQVLGKLGNWRRVLQLIEWLQLRDRFKSHKMRHIYTAALSVLSKARRPVEALNLFHAMQQHMSTYPDLVAYRCIAVTLGQAGYVKELFEVIDSMRSAPKKKFKTGVLEKWDPRLEPDIVVYNAVLNGCVRRKQWEGAFWVLQQLKEQGKQPTTTTYGLVMEVMSASGKYNLVHDLFKKVLKSSIPNSLTYKVLVNTLWREGKIDEAILAVEDMERRGIVGSAALYYDLARCLCSAGRCQEALIQIDKICKVATKPLVVTYTGLIQACLDSGNIENGALIFNHMHEFCSPNLVTCNIMLKAYLEHGMFQEAKVLFKKMLEDGNCVRSKADYKDAVLPDIYTFNTMLEACVTEQRWDDFELVYKHMLCYGYNFNAKRHLKMIMDAQRVGKGELLEITLNHLARAGQTPPPPLLMEVFCMKLEQGDHAAALSSVSGHHFGTTPQLGFSHKAWLNCLRENAHRFPKDGLLRFVDEGSILMSRSDSQGLILQNLVLSCSEFLRTHVTVAELYYAQNVNRSC